MRRILLPLLLLLSLKPACAATPFRAVEACFVLDTTGSMSGLIDAAKRKIWYVANQIVSASARPTVRLCLLAFRDRGDAYVTKRFDLTSDIDGIYKELMALAADGGGDTPEAVNQALLEAVEQSSWSENPDVLRLIFLFGDAPPHTDYPEPQYAEVAARAKQRGILINPVLCGADRQTQDIFAAIAGQSGGAPAQIVDTGRVERIETPMDQDLAALNQRLGRLILPWGDVATREAVLAKQALAEQMDDVGVSERLAFNHATGRIVQGSGDLLQDLAAGSVDLASVPRDALPESVRSMSESELLSYLEDVRQQRDELQRVIDRLIARRQAYIDARRSGAAGGFDGVVATLLARQMGKGT